jgi:hypothetical protein
VTKIDYITREKSGVNNITLVPASKSEATRHGVMDAALVGLFVAAFVGLIFLLARWR